MFTSFYSHLPAVVETGITHASNAARGWIQADDAALARRMAPC
jgi:hypothetical protein